MTSYPKDGLLGDVLIPSLSPFISRNPRRTIGRRQFHTQHDQWLEQCPGSGTISSCFSSFFFVSYPGILSFSLSRSHSSLSLSLFLSLVNFFAPSFEFCHVRFCGQGARTPVLKTYNIWGKTGRHVQEVP